MSPQILKATELKLGYSIDLALAILIKGDMLDPDRLWRWVGGLEVGVGAAAMHASPYFTVVLVSTIVTSDPRTP